MKRCYLIGLLTCIVPTICMGQSATVSKLIREKQRKMEELEKCMGTTKGLKIAGISTIGVTAVGVAGNIVEAKKIKSLDTDIEKVDKKIDKIQSDIDVRRAEIAKKEQDATERAKADAEKAAVDTKNKECIEIVKKEIANHPDDYKDKIDSFVGVWSRKVVSDGYTDHITFNGIKTECQSGKTYKDCLGDDELNYIAAAQMEAQVINEKCGIEIPQSSYLSIQSVKNSENKSDTESDFAQKCVELGGTYVSGKNEFTGNNIKAIVTIHDGCNFKSSDDLEGKCKQVEQLTNSEYKSYTAGTTCAFIDDVDWKCINGQSECRDSNTNDATDTPANTTPANTTPSETPVEETLSGETPEDKQEKGSLESECFAKGEIRGEAPTYEEYGDAKFCLPYNLQNKSEVKSICDSIGMNVCTVYLDDYHESQNTRYVCSSDCSKISDSPDNRPDFLRSL